MSFETFQQGPAVYIPILLVSLLITLVAYGAFPLIFARVRKASITRKKYTLLCFGFNFLIMILFLVLNGGSSGAPYFLWTGVFSVTGLRTLESRGVLAGAQSDNQQKTAPAGTVKVRETPAFGETLEEEDRLFPEGNPQIRFCRKCGFELFEDSKFCSRCGAEIAEE